MILDGRWEQHHHSWPRTPGCRGYFWLREDLRRCSPNWACDRSVHPESDSTRAGMRPSPRSHEQMCLKERSRSEEHTSELQSRLHLVCRLLLEKKKKDIKVHR